MKLTYWSITNVKEILIVRCRCSSAEKNKLVFCVVQYICVVWVVTFCEV